MRLAARFPRSSESVGCKVPDPSLGPASDRQLQQQPDKLGESPNGSQGNEPDKESPNGSTMIQKHKDEAAEAKALQGLLCARRDFGDVFGELARKVRPPMGPRWIDGVVDGVVAAP